MTPAPFDRGVLFLLGGARSGKTRRALAAAEDLFERRALAPIYIATAQAFDDEMRARIDAHKAERGDHWTTVEAPRDLSQAIGRETSEDRVLLVDCLTLWTSNLMLADEDLAGPTEALVAALKGAAGPVIVVSNEVGLGVVPETALGRRFRDEAGRINQRVADAADRVEFVAAGLPMRLKG
ncbi:MAG: bifunctional adenosylcobinamide kinase/adenosylcobinamide-phosphate guanylyltransferase [Marivibrio sp.]|uniref:bifunctional adenosylcobinamide kinase/adenosylcobinamide-phosphate guanylyltransferase n=1 Tax=Marivibrio sp. TaxID=2039719 RepID=UPI0032EF7785